MCFILTNNKMRFRYFDLLLIFGCSLAVNAGEYSYNISYFEVPIDHFSFASNYTFKIRYLTNDTYSKGDRSSPIFFYTGNEGDIELFAKNTGFMWEIAKEFGATLVFAEHRYYGKSMPYGNLSLTAPEYSGYLTSEQALADYAKLLIEQVNLNQRPVIAFGGSYGGMLSAWFRMKHPHIVKGTIAASAPILQFVTECSRFNIIVSSVFTVGQGNCSTNIRNTWDLLKNLSAKPEGRATLMNKFKLCKNLTSPDDINEINDYLTNVYGNLAMVNYPYNTSFLAPLPPNPVTEFCARINGSYNDDQLLDALANALQIYSNYTGQIQCLDTKSSYDPNMGDLGWEFQTRTEMVMPMCSSKNNKNMFPPNDWNFKEFSDECYLKFKVRPDKNMAIRNYGGADLRYASNIIFSNGLMDPWSGGGVLRTPNDKVTIIIIPDTAHHLDLRESNPNDSQSVIAARLKEKRMIRSWLDHDNEV